jgi:hypothetical protein
MNAIRRICPPHIGQSESNGMDAPTLKGIAMCQSGGVNQPLEQTGVSDMKVTTLGIDLAKNVFQLYSVNEFGKTVIKVAGSTALGSAESKT